jgi:hypothetical protein
VIRFFAVAARSPLFAAMLYREFGNDTTQPVPDIEVPLQTIISSHLILTYRLLMLTTDQRHRRSILPTSASGMLH